MNVSCGMEYAVLRLVIKSSKSADDADWDTDEDVVGLGGG